MKRKPNGYWTLEKCNEEAQKYNHKVHFLKSSASAYRIAQRNGWLDDICRHMFRLIKPNFFWTKERCSKEALKYTSRNEFHLKLDAAYRTAQKKGWLEEICAHMEYVTLPRNYWNKERCAIEAGKYESRSQFEKGCSSAYASAQLNNWIDEVCSHMKIQEHGWLHCIYVIENKRLNKAYVGLTRQQFETRAKQHKSDKNTTNSALITLEKDTEYIQLTPYIYDAKTIALKEQEFVDDYNARGFIVLNSEIQIGKIGSRNTWNKKKCRKEALKFTTTTDFIKGSNGAYISAKKYGWFDEITEHLEVTNTPNGYWTKERCHLEALKFETRGEFRSNSNAYQRARERGWLDEICLHMKDTRKPLSFWTDEQCAMEAMKYTSRGDFEKGSSSAYSVARENGWMDIICAHMTSTKKSKGYWTIDRCHEEALKYKVKVDFKNKSGGAYTAARKKGWMDEVCSHMMSLQKPSGYWTKERCQQEALRYKVKEDFRKESGGAYSAAIKNGWLEEVCSHIKSQRVPRGYWGSKERCAEEALKYPSKYQFKAGNRGAYSSARKNGWLDEICQHMN
ncbi:GIY-YIG nuclease family protein [Colwellia sp. BRX8-4]|uniref:GIY-YIG nuclease family protein n=1 Tax=Colwellia sp. BRX8-4 TaxID=2759836 RepID=UPI0015F4902B|nr:GIY-YIG nuclease family protein [Colwellia sp. BRX8-4]MBA6372505.1 GIY-YIG nuclease family protein [Colwellia sp. BRX8-4]